METVEVSDLGASSIVTLMLKQILDRNLMDPQKRALMNNRLLTVHVHVRLMAVTVSFEADRVRAENGAHGKPDIVITGDMQTLLSVAVGGDPLLLIWKRRLKVRPRRWRGWIYCVRLLLLMQVGQSPTYLLWLIRKDRRPTITDSAVSG